MYKIAFNEDIGSKKHNTRHFILDDWTYKNYRLIPIRSIRNEYHSGNVCNLSVVGNHTYLVNGIAVHNCYAHKSRDLHKGQSIIRVRNVDDVLFIFFKKK